MIQFSVGAGGQNLIGDVFYVQFLLVDWLVRKSRPAISIDGLCGQHTLEAIGHFQAQCTNFNDRRIDPNGPTLKALQTQHLKGLISGTPNAAIKMPGFQKRIIGSGAMLELQNSYFRELRSGFD